MLLRRPSRRPPTAICSNVCLFPGRDDRGVRAGPALLPRHAAQGQGVPGQGLLPIRKVDGALPGKDTY